MRKLSLIILIFFIVNASFTQHQEITLEKIWKQHLFNTRGVSGFKSMPDGNFYSVLSKTGIDKYSFETGEKTTTLITDEALKAMSKDFFSMKDIDSYEFDKTENQILIGVDKSSIFRRSSSAFYYIINLQNNTITPLDDTLKGKQSFPTFSPDGKKIAFVRNNDLYIRYIDGNIIRITEDGKENAVKNGFADWVYEEELSLTEAFEWSPDNSKIAYMRFDESRVKEFSMTIFGNLYPETFQYKYPKAGEDNSLVDIYVYDLEKKNSTKLDLGDNSNCYFPRIYWLNNSADLIILKLNRHQNILDFYRYNTSSKAMDLVFTDHNSFWLSIEDHYCFLNDNNSMITMSERDGWQHIYKVTFNGKTTQLTKGEWEVADICGVDKEKQLIYYLSNEQSPLNRDLYVVNFDGKKKKLLTSGDGWNNISFNNTTHYYLKGYSNSITLPKYTICNNKGEELRVLQDNHLVKETMDQHGFVKKEMFQVTTEEKITLNGWMVKPVDFTETKKYPVLMYVYGGPGSQEVSNSWYRGMDFAWYQMLAQKGYIVVCVDGRGTAARGDSFKKSIYKQMGKFESDDQIAAAKELKKLPYVDENRVGIWGWSFGGYLSSLAMFKGAGEFKMAIAVAPVTNWRYYDNIYTERFLQTPNENPAGYDENSPIFHADKLDGAYLLIHGTADDNVHFQNSIDLSTKLIQSGKQFEELFYPNMNHFINAGNARFHLYTKMTDFILKNL